MGCRGNRGYCEFDRLSSLFDGYFSLLPLVKITFLQVKITPCTSKNNSCTSKNNSCTSKNNSCTSKNNSFINVGTNPTFFKIFLLSNYNNRTYSTSIKTYTRIFSLKYSCFYSMNSLKLVHSCKSHLYFFEKITRNVFTDVE